MKIPYDEKHYISVTPESRQGELYIQICQSSCDQTLAHKVYRPFGQDPLLSHLKVPGTLMLFCL